jgi:hypothetical protein
MPFSQVHVGELGEVMGWEKPPNILQDLFCNWIPLSCDMHNLKPILLASVLWSLWTIRNKIAIKGVSQKLQLKSSSKLLSICRDVGCTWGTLIKKAWTAKDDSSAGVD